MRAGDLDQRVTLQRREEGEDEAGQPYSGWVDVASYWAAVEPLRGREYLAAQAIATETTTRIRMRYVPGIDSAMRVQHGADTYGIDACIHVKSARQELQLMCKRVG